MRFFWFFFFSFSFGILQCYRLRSESTGRLRKWRAVLKKKKMKAPAPTPSRQLVALSVGSLGTTILKIWVPNSSSRSNLACSLTLLVWRLVKSLEKVHAPLSTKDCRFLSFAYFSSFFLSGFLTLLTRIRFYSRFSVLLPTIYFLSCEIPD